MKILLPGFLSLIFLLGMPSLILSQGHSDTLTRKVDCYPMDIQDIVFKKSEEEPFKISKKTQLFILPLIAFSPATSLSFGAGSAVSWFMGKDSLTRISAGVANVTYTLKNQLIVQVKTNMQFPRNQWYLQTDWRLYLFNLPTYGLGTGNGRVIPEITGITQPPSAYFQSNASYPMNFNWIKFHNILSRRVAPDLFVGLGYHLDSHFGIVDELLDTAKGVYTPHFAYSVNNGFNRKQYISSGFSANFVYDSRDNIINPYSGFFVQVNYRFNKKIFGSSANGSQLWTEFRTYVGLSRKNPRHVLAFWIYGSFLVSGKIPYLDLMSTGFDQMNSSGRGYPQGRWRGEDVVYGELEYRFPISRCSGIIGGVLFANVTTASSREMNIPLFGYFKGGAGFGVRIMLNKHDRTNLLIDFGMGRESQGLYIQAQEIF